MTGLMCLLDAARVLGGEGALVDTERPRQGASADAPWSDQDPELVAADDRAQPGERRT